MLGRGEVRTLTCNGEVALAGMMDGKVWGWGEDAKGLGVLGMGEVTR